jgi:hypothetical protein
MCQFLCFDCWWCNFCGIVCGGVHNAICVCSYWLCKPEELAAIDPECCHIMACDGWGGNCFFFGDICCAPDSVKEWSRLKSGGGGVDVVVVNNYSS